MGSLTYNIMRDVASHDYKIDFMRKLLVLNVTTTLFMAISIRMLKKEIEDIKKEQA